MEVRRERGKAYSWSLGPLRAPSRRTRDAAADIEASSTGQTAISQFASPVMTLTSLAKKASGRAGTTARQRSQTRT